MTFLVQYRMDDVGYSKMMTATNKEQAEKDCHAECQKVSPRSIITVESVEEIVEASTKKKKKKE